MKVEQKGQAPAKKENQNQMINFDDLLANIENMQPTAAQQPELKKQNTNVNDPFGFFDTWEPPK